MFYLIDKPISMSSFDTIRILRKKGFPKKMGYLGTLDPLASGLLLLATGGSTKLLSLLADTAKTYTYTVDISGRSDSLDAGTPVSYMPADTVSQIRTDWPDTRIHTDLPQYIQSISQQVPPMYSALHIDGERAYTRVRSGEVFDIPSRPVHIQDVRILGIDFPCIHIQSTLSSGGYIRSLAPMISQYMSEGYAKENFGYIQNLRRTALLCGTGDMDISLSTPLLDIDIGQSIPYEKIFPHIPMYPLYIGADEDLVHKEEEAPMITGGSEMAPMIRGIGGLKNTEHVPEYTREYEYIQVGRDILLCEDRVKNVYENGQYIFITYNTHILALGKIENGRIYVVRKDIV